MPNVRVPARVYARVFACQLSSIIGAYSTLLRALGLTTEELTQVLTVVLEEVLKGALQAPKGYARSTQGYGISKR
jgi:hypothetical protein